MQKTTERLLNAEIKRVQGEKEGKSYDFYTVEVMLKNETFTLYPNTKDKKLFDYLLKQEVEE